jgi:hypothetical protein
MRENYLNLVFKPTDKNASTLKLSFRPSHQTCDERAVERNPPQSSGVKLKKSAKHKQVNFDIKKETIVSDLDLFCFFEKCNLRIKSFLNYFCTTLAKMLFLPLNVQKQTSGPMHLPIVFFSLASDLIGLV